MHHTFCLTLGGVNMFRLCDRLEVGTVSGDMGVFGLIHASPDGSIVQPKRRTTVLDQLLCCPAIQCIKVRLHIVSS